MGQGTDENTAGLVGDASMEHAVLRRQLSLSHPASLATSKDVSLLGEDLVMSNTRFALYRAILAPITALPWMGSLTRLRTLGVLRMALAETAAKCQPARTARLLRVWAMWQPRPTLFL